MFPGSLIKLVYSDFFIFIKKCYIKVKCTLTKYYSMLISNHWTITITPWPALSLEWANCKERSHTHAYCSRPIWTLHADVNVIFGAIHKFPLATFLLKIHSTFSMTSTWPQNRKVAILYEWSYKHCKFDQFVHVSMAVRPMRVWNNHLIRKRQNILWDYTKASSNSTPLLLSVFRLHAQTNDIWYLQQCRWTFLWFSIADPFYKASTQMNKILQYKTNS